MRRRRGVAARLFGGALLLLTAAWLLILVTIVVLGQRDGAAPADAIVVLGAAQYEGRPSPVLRARLDHAITLWEQGLVPRMILTGGQGERDTLSEAAVGRRYMIARGVPDTAIVLEARGRTSSQSLQAVATYLRGGNGGARVILVSDQFHMFRLWILARRFGLDPLLSPAHGSPIATSPRRWTYVLLESLKVPVTFLTEHALD